MHHLGEKYNRIRLARPLSVPENPQFTQTLTSINNGINCTDNTEVLVIAGNDFHQTARALVKQGEVFKDVHKVGLRASFLQQGLHIHNAWFILFQSLPVIEMLKFTGNGANLGVNTIAQDNKGVVIKQVRDGVFVLRNILLIGSTDILVNVFHLHKQQRNTIHKAHKVCSATINIAFDPKHSDQQEVIVFVVVKIKQAKPFLYPFTFFVMEAHLYAILMKGIFLLICSNDITGCWHLTNHAQRLLVGDIRQARVELYQFLAQIAG